MLEPGRLAKVRTAPLSQTGVTCAAETHVPLARNLEGEPLEFDVLVRAGAGYLMVFVVLVDQVFQDREGLPGLMISHPPE